MTNASAEFMPAFSPGTHPWGNIWGNMESKIKDKTWVLTKRSHLSLDCTLKTGFLRDKHILSSKGQKEKFLFLFSNFTFLFYFPIIIICLTVFCWAGSPVSFILSKLDQDFVTYFIMECFTQSSSFFKSDLWHLFLFNLKNLTFFF